MQSLKYGLIATVGYMIILTVLLALTAWVNISGIRGLHDLITPFNIVLTIIDGIVVFIAGYCFPCIFSRMVADYQSEYPDVPEKYVIQICRGKLMKKYSLNIATGCFLASLFICIGKRPPIIVWYLVAIGTLSLMAYIRYGQKYKNL
jgi:hypothetical protein